MKAESQHAYGFYFFMLGACIAVQQTGQESKKYGREHCFRNSYAVLF